MVEDALEEGEIEGLVNEPPSELVRREHASVDVMPALLQGYTTKAECAAGAAGEVCAPNTWAGRSAWEEAHKEAEKAEWGRGLL